VADEPKDEREFKAELELSSGALLPGGKLAVSFRRLWDKRVDDLAADVIDIAEIDADEFAGRIAAGDPAADLFRIAAERVVTDGDPFLRDVLARLVAAALDDDAEIHEVSYLMDQLAGLHPLHIRVLWSLTPGGALRSAQARSASPPSAREAERSERNYKEIAASVRASWVLVEGAMAVLTEKNFAGRDAEGWFFLLPLGERLRDVVGDIHGAARTEGRPRGAGAPPRG
jgi:hypothetical protein